MGEGLQWPGWQLQEVFITLTRSKLPSAILFCSDFSNSDEILKMVQCSSSRPRLRLSLSLASRLVNGVTKIYRRQVELTIDDLHAFTLKVRAPRLDLSLTLEEGTPRTPVPKVRKRRKRSSIQLSDEPAALSAVIPAAIPEEDLLAPLVIDEAQLDQPSLVQADPDLITLREELIVQPREAPMTVEEFGVLEDVEPPLFPDVQALAPSFPSEAQLITPQKRKQRGSLGTPSKSRRITQNPELDEISVLPPEMEAQVVPDVPQVEMPVQAAPQQAPELAVVPQIEIHVEKARPPPKRRMFTKANIKIQTKRFVHINRCLPTDREYLDLPYDPVPLVEHIDYEENETYKLVALFLEAIEPTQEVEELLRQLRDPSKTVDSLFRTPSLTVNRPRRRGTSVIPQVSPIPLVSAASLPVESTIGLKPYQTVVQADVHVPDIAEEPPIQIERLEVPDKSVKPLAESTAVSLSQIDVDIANVLPERTIETEIAPAAAQTARPQRAVVQSTDSAEVQKKLVKNRQKRIRDIVKAWDIEEQGAITLEGVCHKPVNRYNVAIAFSDLLSLHKMGYVKLINKSDSLELGVIEKGPRVKRQL